ncbi:OB-fold protein [Scopulibacillus cellulosilyticus]|uniref:Nucleic acid binding protein n=1 Tax=Scopulibacillus cellulosilyticus TaxID=2665665 RepID=A0ABW2PS31_9BACL
MSNGTKTIIAILVIVVVVSAGMFTWMKLLQHSTSNNMVNHAAESKVIKVSAEKYAEQYKKDKKAADEKYQDTVVQITGNVKEVKDHQLILNGTYPIDAKMQKNVSLDHLKKGQVATFRGFPIGLDPNKKELVFTNAKLIK